jgi:two-component system chemotaxis response regulator CheY
MTRPLILCVEDEPEVLEVLIRDLEPFAIAFHIEPVEDTAEAREVIQASAAAGEPLALVLCDHVLPREKGVDFLIALRGDDATKAARLVLVTGQAGLDDTVRAVNRAGLDHYVAKPWNPEELRAVVRDQLTEFVIDQSEDLLPFVPVLDGVRLMGEIQSRKSSE